MAYSTDLLESIFTAAIEIERDVDRGAFVAQACGGDPDLRRCVDELIENHFRAGSFLQPPGNEHAPLDLVKSGDEIGPYKIRKQIGEGGMGVVYLAEQERPVCRRVALKVIRSGLHSSQVLARFEQERQALALMDHPNIARVLDAGVTEDGRPYFAMELVEGTPITQYCDQAGLTLRERILLLIPVCRAVQHAHQKGIIHRDLKPSNILVAPGDGQPVPKVIDFGVAKATGRTLADRTRFTEAGQILGTMEYMAPEQADQGNVDIDTRADVYSLGVLLYELLTGAPPFTTQTLRQAGLGEMLRVIKEVDPTKPSTKITSADTVPRVAMNRRWEPARLARQVRGDLDWITMKCLEKSRARRYDTANGLANDLERFLANEPVVARPPSVGYRVSKFIRRNRATAVAAILVFLSLVVGIIGIAIALSDATRQKRIAQEAHERETQARQREQERADAEANERRRAELAEAEGKVIIDFLRYDLIGQAGSLAQAERQFEPNPNLTVREALDRAAAAVGAKFHDQPDTEAAIRKTIGDSYLQLGLYDKAIEQLELSVDIRQQRLGPEHAGTLETKDSLAQAYRGATRFAEAIELLEQNSAIRSKLLGPDHVTTLITRDNLAVTYRDGGQGAEAIALFEQIRDAKLRAVGPNDPTTLTTLHNLASMYLDAGDTAQAIASLNQVYMARVSALGPEHPDTLPSLQNLAVTYWKAQELHESIPRFEQLLRLYDKIYGGDHWLTVSAKANLGINYRDAERYVEAVALLEEARRAGTGKPNLNWIGRELSIAYERAGEFDKLIALEKLLLAESRTTVPADSSQLASLLAATGATLLRLQAWADAETVLRECVAIREVVEPDAWRTFHAKSLLGEALLGQAKFEAAETPLLQGYEGLVDHKAEIPQGSEYRISDALQRLVQLYESWGKPEAAAKWREMLAR